MTPAGRTRVLIRLSSFLFVGSTAENKKEVKTAWFSPPGVGGVLRTIPLAVQHPSLPGRSADSLAICSQQCGQETYHQRARLWRFVTPRFVPVNGKMSAAGKSRPFTSFRRSIRIQMGNPALNRDFPDISPAVHSQVSLKPFHSCGCSALPVRPAYARIFQLDVSRCNVRVTLKIYVGWPA